MLTVDPGAPEPLYDQVRRQVAEQVLAGALPVGTRLPSVRRLAGDLGIAPNTVARAYRELEVGGVIRSRGRGGTFVVGSQPPVDDEPRAAAQAYAALTRRLGLAAEDAVRLVRQALDDGDGGLGPQRP